MAGLVADVADQRPVRLVHVPAHCLAMGIVRFRDIERDEAAVVPGITFGPPSGVRSRSNGRPRRGSSPGFDRTGSFSHSSWAPRPAWQTESRECFAHVA